MVRHVIDVDARDSGLLPGADAAPSQRPFAAILGCSDARVPLELIFNEGPNDLLSSARQDEVGSEPSAA